MRRGAGLGGGSGAAEERRAARRTPLRAWGRGRRQRASFSRENKLPGDGHLFLGGEHLAVRSRHRAFVAFSLRH